MHLYLPRNKDARGIAPATRDALARVLGDQFHLWANVNFERWEFDWLVFDARKGWFGIYEEKRPRGRVIETFSAADKWILADGSRIENPYDQVARHADAFREYIRRELCPRYFEALDRREVTVYRGVLCPAITAETILIEPRFGLVFGDEDAFAQGLSTLSPRVKLRLKAGDSLGALIAHLNRALAASETATQSLRPSPATKQR